MTKTDYQGKAKHRTIVKDSARMSNIVIVSMTFWWSGSIHFSRWLKMLRRTERFYVSSKVQCCSRSTSLDFEVFQRRIFLVVVKVYFSSTDIAVLVSRWVILHGNLTPLVPGDTIWASYHFHVNTHELFYIPEKYVETEDLMSLCSIWPLMKQLTHV